MSERGLLLLLDDPEKRQRAATMIVLSWLSAVDDDRPDAREIAAILKGAKQMEGGLDEAWIGGIARHATNPRVSELAMSFGVLRMMDAELRRNFIELACGVALSDGRLQPIELHALELIADLLGASRELIVRVHKSFGAGEVPTRDDPSTVSYWQRRGHKRGSRFQSGSIATAYEILGLESGCSLSTAKRAWQRLRKQYHPDRYQILGEEAVAIANDRFTKVADAWEKVRAHLESPRA